MSSNLTENTFESSLFHTFEQQRYLQDFFFFIKQFVNKHFKNQHGFLGWKWNMLFMKHIILFTIFLNVIKLFNLFKCHSY